VCDGNGRVIDFIFGRSQRGQQLLQEFKGSRGIAEETLVPHLQEGLPQGLLWRKNLGSGLKSRGKLILFVDPSIQQELVGRATRQMGRDLLPILVLAMILGGGVLWLLARQRQTTERLRLQRDQAEGMAHVGTLAAGLAHEIRNPVNALAMQLEMLEEDL